MESDTIDLTDPLEDILQQSQWTPECLNERLCALAGNNSNSKQTKHKNITLSDLLGDCNHSLSSKKSAPDKIASSKFGDLLIGFDCEKTSSTSVLEPTDAVIELSDDEVTQIANSVEKEMCESIEDITEVEVIEISDFSDNCGSDKNEDDDVYEESYVDCSTNDMYTNVCQDRSLIDSNSENIGSLNRDPLILDNINEIPDESRSDQSKPNRLETCAVDKKLSPVCCEVEKENLKSQLQTDDNSLVQNCHQSPSNVPNINCDTAEDALNAFKQNSNFETNREMITDHVATNEDNAAGDVDRTTTPVADHLSTSIDNPRSPEKLIQGLKDNTIIDDSPVNDLTESSSNTNLSPCHASQTSSSDTFPKETADICDDITEDSLPSKSSRGEENTFNESIDNETEETFESLEEIRRNLKLQLTSLRTRKKMNILQDVKQTLFQVDELNKSRTINKPLSDSSSIVSNSECKSKTDDAVASVIKNRESILNASSSNHRITPANSQEEDGSDVFNEIRKIIRKPKLLGHPNDIERNVAAEGRIETAADTGKMSPETNAGNSNILDRDREAAVSDVKRESKSATSSPFISNTLDEFLIDSKLNVSYCIPKSGAEEGLRQNYALDPVVLFDSKIKEEQKKPTEGVKYKPKTLAEKRRILERNKLREERRMKKLRMQSLDSRSYVIFRNRKTFVAGKETGKCIASIESNSADVGLSTPSTTFKKPSLLTEYYRKTCPTKYRPGPLSKKYLLQTDYSQWTTELKALPRVLLNVMPQLGKPVHPNLLSIICQGKGKISTDQMEFALSALVNTKPEQKIFKFDVNYEKRQEKLLIRKKIAEDKPYINIDCAADGTIISNVEEEVSRVIDKLITYVEIKEISSTVIKNDENYESLVDDPSPKNEKPIAKKRTPRGLSRTSMELLRLNCKLVSIESKLSEPKMTCSKPYCRLGCVCKSLKCETIIGIHCQKVKCMFGCSCPKERNKVINISEPIFSVGSDFLSRDTVTRIEDKAKKNLAKVEKEFTQTIIYANDKTIVVGAGNKPRRAARMPKKYTDFFDENVCEEARFDSRRDTKTLCKPCEVFVEKWDFSNIMPYCLAHHLYNCHCKGLDALSLMVKNEKLEPHVSSQDEVMKGKNPKIIEIEQNRSSNDGKSSELIRLPSGRIIRRKKSDYVKYEDNMSEFPEGPKTPNLTSRAPSCSRAIGIPERYRSTKTFTATATLMDFANNITEADVLRLKLTEDDNLSDSDMLKRNIIEERRRLNATLDAERPKKHKRKQQIEVRQDEDLDVKTSLLAPKKKPKGNIGSVFRGEIIVDNAEWLKKLCNNPKQPLDGYARILPWDALLKGFLSKSINVYCICDMPLRLMLNVGSKIVGDKIVDIETRGQKILEASLKGKAPWLISQSENVRDIIKWLLSGSLSPKYKESTLSFLLVETQSGQFEVRGLCTQNDNAQDMNTQVAGKSASGEDISDEITEIKHKNMNNEIESLFITKRTYRLRELIEDGFDDDLADNLYMWVGLPEVHKIAKWRMLFLKNDFVYLYFKNIKYSIKYTDLIKLTAIAKEENVTLLIRNLQIRRNHDHTLFGVYVTPTYSDRIFVGPYFINYDEEDIETLKYIKESLISSESYNRMKGNVNYKCGHWMYERPYYHVPKNFPKDTIDLTSDDIAASMPTTGQIKSPPPQWQPSAMAIDEHVISHNGIPILIKNVKPRAPSEFNRFIITNIPHFGYLGAYQADRSSSLEVSWPFEKKVLQFENADHARDFLQERFSQLLQPVPETFKIQVIVLIQLDLKEHQPINSDFLSGHCICGYFGTYNFKELSDELCRRELNTTKAEITKLFAKRAHDYIRKKIADLAEVSGVDPDDKGNYNVENILNKAKDVVKLQQQLRIQQIAEIHAMENEAVVNIKKLFNMIRELPPKERNIESKILNESLHIRPKRVGVGVSSEVIEINDDDGAIGSDNECQEKVIRVYPSSSKYSKGLCKKEHSGDSREFRKLKIAKVAPFSSTLKPVKSTTVTSDQVEPCDNLTPRHLIPDIKCAISM